MPLADVFDGYDTTLEYGDDLVADAATWTEVEELDSVTPPPVSVAVVEQKPHGAAGKATRKRPGWKTPGDASFQVLQTKANTSALDALIGDTIGWRITHEDGSTVEFDGFITNSAPAVNKEGDNVIVYTLTAQGLPVFTPAA